MHNVLCPVAGLERMTTGSAVSALPYLALPYLAISNHIRERILLITEPEPEPEVDKNRELIAISQSCIAISVYDRYLIAIFISNTFALILDSPRL